MAHRKLLACVVVVLACSEACPERSRGTPPKSVGSYRDDFSQQYSFDSAPRRIASLNPTTTEILFAIGAGPRVVGRSEYDSWPPSAKQVTSLGPGLRPNLEAIVGVKPDLVMLYASDDNRSAALRLGQLGIRTVAFKLDRIAQFDRDTRLIGRITGDSARAAQVVDSVLTTLNAVRQATSALPKPTVFVHVWDKPVMAIGGGSFINELLEIAGAKNIYAADSVPSLTVTLEDVVRRDPDIMLTTTGEVERIRANPVWKTLRAVREGHVVGYDADLVARPSVQLGAAAWHLARLLHPGKLP